MLGTDNLLISISNKLDANLKDIDYASLPEEARGLFIDLFSASKALTQKIKRVVFFGEFNAGKSTLVNNLISANLLPTDINRSTGVVTEIHYSPLLSVKGRFKTASSHYERDIPVDEISHYIQLDIDSSNEAKAHPSIERISIGAPAQFLENNWVLVDTPGLDDNSEMTRRTMKELHQADLAVLVIMASKAGSSIEKDGARLAHRVLNGNIVFFINRTNLITSTQVQKVVRSIQTSMKGVGNPLVGIGQVFIAYTRDWETGQNEPIIDLDEFRGWLRDLDMSMKGEKLAALSRLAHYSRLLSEVLVHVERQHSLLESDLRKAFKNLEENHREENKQLQLSCRSALLKLGLERQNLDATNALFIKFTNNNLNELIQNDSGWANEELKRCLYQAIDSYSTEIFNSASIALGEMRRKIDQHPFTIPETVVTFKLPPDFINWLITAIGAGGGLLFFNVVGGMVGLGLGKVAADAIRGDAMKEQARVALEQTAYELLPTLRQHAQIYLLKLEEVVKQKGDRPLAFETPRYDNRSILEKKSAQTLEQLKSQALLIENLQQQVLEGYKQ